MEELEKYTELDRERHLSVTPKKNSTSRRQEFSFEQVRNFTAPKKP